MVTQLDVFYNATRYDISGFFERFKDFVDNYYTNYIGYYRGISKLDPNAVTLLNNLVSESASIEELFSLNRDTLSRNVEFWDLYEDFSNCLVKIETMKNTPKWTRSSYRGNYDKDVKIDYILKQNQLVEHLTEQLGYTKPDEDWVNIAINNGLKEVDYDLSGGNLLSVSFQVNNDINTNSVIDLMVGDNLVGKDIIYTLVIEDNDLKTLTPKQTIQQSSEILLGVTVGSVPEFPRDGVDLKIIGTNIKAIQYPTIFRQLISIFKKDDTFKEIQVTDLYYEGDNVIVSLRIVSKLNDVIAQNIYLNE